MVFHDFHGRLISTRGYHYYFIVNGVTCIIVKYGVNMEFCFSFHDAKMPKYEKLTKPLYTKAKLDSITWMQPPFRHNSTVSTLS